VLIDPDKIRISAQEREEIMDSARRLRPPLPWEPGWKVLVGACLLAGVAGALVLGWVRSGPVAKPSEADHPNTAPLMASMAAHPQLSGTTQTDWSSRMTQSLEQGVAAPEFTLPAIRSRDQITLSRYRGRPVVLVFGSLSCELFCKRAPDLQRLCAAHKDRAEFLFVSVTEAGHRIPGLEFVLGKAEPEGVDPLEGRRARLAKALDRLGLSMPGAVDAGAAAEGAYDAFPTRLVVVDAGGRIALDLGRPLIAPWDLSKVAAWLAKQEQQAARPEPSAG
jgi:hypothetical protein